jgi:hypothetical protein
MFSRLTAALISMQGFDIRVPPSVDLGDLEAKIKDWTKVRNENFVLSFFLCILV